MSTYTAWVTWHSHDEDDGLGPDFCASCYRDDYYLEPVATHPDGRVKYRGSCRWCYEFEHKHGELPSLPRLRAHHAGRRMETGMSGRVLPGVPNDPALPDVHRSSQSGG